MSKRFRPLAGMSCNPQVWPSEAVRMSFRPLAGMSCNMKQGIKNTLGYIVSVPSRG